MGKRPKGPIHVSKKKAFNVLQSMYKSLAHSNPSIKKVHFEIVFKKVVKEYNNQKQPIPYHILYSNNPWDLKSLKNPYTKLIEPFIDNLVGLNTDYHPEGNGNCIVEENLVNKIINATKHGNERSGHNLNAARLYPTKYENETERKLRKYREKRNLDGKILNLEICSGNGNISSWVITHFPFKIPKEEFYISPVNVSIYSKNRIKFILS